MRNPDLAAMQLGRHRAALTGAARFSIGEFDGSSTPTNASRMAN